MPFLIFPVTLDESDPDSLCSYLSHLLIRALEGVKELDAFMFGLNAPEGWQPEGFESE